jgi:hypothetical protein
MATPMPPQRAEEVRHLHGLEVARLETDRQTQVLALRGYREGGQRRDPVMPIMVADDGSVPLRRPGAAARRDAQKVTFIQESTVRPQAPGLFLWPAPGRVANGQ